ncbi:MAG TPA: DinB family protein [Phycisphaerae bacterium]|nr:DinB family protein [Phycisphaerae bacterium]
MTAKDVIREAIGTARFVTQQYVGDLSDQELLMRPAPQANHLAWQLGHLICSAHDMMTGVGVSMPALPAGFAERHASDAASSPDTAGYGGKQAYLSLMEQVREAALAALERLPDAQLDQPAPEAMRSYAPTVGSVFAMVGLHELMHTGQFAVLRRKLGKPIVI